MSVAASPSSPSSSSSLNKVPDRLTGYGPGGPYSPHHPKIYTLISVAIFAGFFFQPLEWRKAIMSWALSITQDEKLLFVFGSWFLHLSVFVVLNSVMGVIYWLDHPFFEQFKVDAKPWPWKSTAPVREEYFSLVKKTIPLLLLNQSIISPVLAWFSWEDARKRGITASLDSVPQWYTTIWQIAFFMVVEDTLFYWAHRMLHHPKLYPYIHKIHHQYRQSIGIASEYTHPVEFILSNAIPFSVGPLIVGAHLFTFWMWTIVRVAETIDGHCGYEFAWSPYRLLPFSGSARVHDYHHSHNVGNFASFFTWWDHYMGTDAAYLKFVEKEEEQWKAYHQQKSNTKKIE